MVKYVYVLQFVHQKTTNQIERQNLVTWGIIKTALTRYDVKITHQEWLLDNVWTTN